MHVHEVTHEYESILVRMHVLVCTHERGYKFTLVGALVHAHELMHECELVLVSVLVRAHEHIHECELMRALIRVLELMHEYEH